MEAPPAGREGTQVATVARMALTGATAEGAAVVLGEGETEVEAAARAHRS